MTDLTTLPQDVLGVIAGKDPIACLRLWPYLVRPPAIAPADWAAQLAVRHVCPEGITTTRLFGLLHSIDDEPARENDHCSEWYHRGKLHRDGAPAIVASTMSLSWNRSGFRIHGQFWHRREHSASVSLRFHHGELSFEDGPAVAWVARAFNIPIPGIMYTGDAMMGHFGIKFSPIHESNLESYQ